MSFHKKWIFCFLLMLFILLPAQFIRADIKDYVFIVRPELDSDTQNMFDAIATYFERQNMPEYANYFRWYTGERGGGTGWIYVDEDGENYVITNRHVVSTGSSANIYFENPDGTRQMYENCPILYVDNSMDLAILQFPNGKRLFEQGFDLDTKRQRDLDRVISAGFPGFGSAGEQIWQLASGEITNSQMHTKDPYFQGYDYLIQHSAPIDHGNSGGPLLKEDPNSPLGYKVVGVNTWKGFAGQQMRENTFLSIPAKEVEHIIEKAKDVRNMADDTELMREQLIRNCKILAAELRSENRREDRVKQYISYTFVGNRGWESFNTVLNLLENSNPEQYKIIYENFYSGNAIETMRYSIYLLFYLELLNRGNLRSIEFKEINYADAYQLEELEEIRTEFLIDDEISEIVWTLEHGQWRISNFQLISRQYFSGSGSGQNAETSAAKRRPSRSGPNGGGGVLLGIDGGLLWWDMEDTIGTAHAELIFTLSSGNRLGFFAGYPSLGGQLLLAAGINTWIALRGGFSFIDGTWLIGGKIYLNSINFGIDYAFPDMGSYYSYPGEIYILFGYAFQL